MNSVSLPRECAVCNRPFDKPYADWYVAEKGRVYCQLCYVNVYLATKPEAKRG